MANLVGAVAGMEEHLQVLQLLQKMEQKEPVEVLVI
jgi:hypothetical protein